MEHTDELRRLPLWEHTLAEMREAGVTYGSSFSREWLEKHLGCAWNTVQFNGEINEIRQRLEENGLFLSARNQGNAGYIILQPEENAAQGRRNQRLVVSLLRRTVVLLSNTDCQDMTVDQRRRHEATLSRAAQRAALVSRTMPRQPVVVKGVRITAP